MEVYTFWKKNSCSCVESIYTKYLTLPGMALIDRSEGEIVEVQVPAGTRKIKIIKVFPKGKEQA